MHKTEIRISSLDKNDKIPYDLLLLSDETKEAINRNLDNGELYAGAYEGEMVAAFILKIARPDSIEIKNIAVTETFQGKGIGSVLLDYIKENAKERGFRNLIVGTCDQCIKEIEFYQKSGFVTYEIRSNFFLDNYKEPIFENGKRIIDMVMLKISL